MARYIDADKFKSNLEKAMEKMHLIGGVKGVDVGAVIIALDRQPTAEVVPKSEVDRLNAVMKDMDEQRAYTINMLGENLENAKSEVERLQAEIETLKDNNEHLAVLLEEAKQAYANYEETTGLKQAKQAYAKEIISEMDNGLHDMAMEYANRGHKAYFAVCEMVHHKVIRPIEKKYTEENEKI